jgi:hypothetical protein
MSNSQLERLVLKNIGRNLNICEGCGSRGEMVIHHIDRRENPDDLLNPLNLLILCNKCHGKVHTGRRKTRKKLNDEPYLKLSVIIDDEVESWIEYIKKNLKMFNISKFVREKIKEYGNKLRSGELSEAMEEENI